MPSLNEYLNSAQADDELRKRRMATDGDEVRQAVQAVVSEAPAVFGKGASVSAPQIFLKDQRHWDYEYPFSDDTAILTISNKNGKKTGRVDVRIWQETYDVSFSSKKLGGHLGSQVIYGRLYRDVKVEGQPQTPAAQRQQVVQDVFRSYLAKKMTLAGLQPNPVTAEPANPVIAEPVDVETKTPQRGPNLRARIKSWFCPTA